MSDKRHSVHAKLTTDQFNLARRRLFVESLNWQTVLTALINAYIMGDISVTAQGRYHLAPPSGHIPVVSIEGEEEVEIEPDWGVHSERPQVGATNYRQHPRKHQRWGTRELVQYLRAETGRRISLQNLRRLLNTIGTPKEDNGRWYFTGPDDENVKEIIDCIDKGLYETLARQGIESARAQAEEIRSQVSEYVEAKHTTKEAQRIKHLRQLRKIESEG